MPIGRQVLNAGRQRVNYQGKARTNYVTVENLEGLKSALEPWPLEVRASSCRQGMAALFDTSGSGWPTFAVDEDGKDLEFDVATLIMPFVREGEVLVVMEAGHEGARYVVGNASAWVRRGEEVLHTHMCLDDIYGRAAREFTLEEGSTGRAMY